MAFVDDLKDIRNQIVNVSRALFAKRGVKHTTVDMIAKESVIAKGTVYNYFDSKSDIFREVIYSEVMAVYSEIDIAVRQAKNVRNKIKALLFSDN